MSLRHSVIMGEAPIAGHLLYTQILDDSQEEERNLGISCHLAFIGAADLVAVYTDRGISRGMQLGGSACPWRSDRSPTGRGRHEHHAA